MPTDIFVVRIIPALNRANPDPEAQFPYLRVTELRRTRRNPRPRLGIRAGGYQEREVYTTDGRDALAPRELGEAILRASANMQTWHRLRRR